MQVVKLTKEELQSTNCQDSLTFAQGLFRFFNIFSNFKIFNKKRKNVLQQSFLKSLSHSVSLYSLQKTKAAVKSFRRAGYNLIHSSTGDPAATSFTEETGTPSRANGNMKSSEEHYQSCSKHNNTIHAGKDTQTAGKPLTSDSMCSGQLFYGSCA